MSYKIIELFQGSPEWLDYRRGKISATDAASILGVAYKKTALQLWEEKLGLIAPEPENDAMREGKILEEKAREFWNKKLNSDFKPVVLESLKYSFLMASLDGMNSEGEILEIKCGKASHEMAKKHELAPYYYSQIQQQIYIANVKYCQFFSYRSDEDFMYFTIERDDAFIEKMIEAEIEFYRRMIEFDPPPATHRDYEVKDSKEWRMSVAVLREARQQLKKYSQIEEDAKMALIELSEGKSCKGHGVRVRKSVRKGAVDYSRIELLKNVDLEVYRKKPIEYYSITEGD